MTAAIQHLIRSADANLARMYLSLFRERNALLCFLFHSLFLDVPEMRLNQIDPLQRTTVQEFRQFIEYYLSHDYRFVTPADVLRGLDAGGKYLCITFDDGYYHNSRTLPILEEYKVPATFFIASDNVVQNKCFWWDVIYRERSIQRMGHEEITDEAMSMKTMRTEQIEQKLIELFGADSFRPRSDLDRPFTPSELREFAKHPLVHIGNHTANHAILTNYSRDEVREQIGRAQETLEQITGTRPVAVAYPNGGHDEQVVAVCQEAGLKVGFTVRPEKRNLPVSEQSAGLLRLGRFATHGESKITTQCRTYRSDVLLYGMFRDAYLRLARNQVAQ